MQVLEMLRGRFHERKNNAAEILVDAAKRAAAGGSVDGAAVENAIVEAGTTVDAFAEMVQLATRRKQWRADHDKLKAAAAKLEKATASAERERAAFEEIRDAWFARAAVLDADISAARATVSAANDARQNLVRPANVPGPVGERLVQCHRELEAANAEVSRFEREVRREREMEKSYRSLADDKREAAGKTVGKQPDSLELQDYERRAESAARRAKVAGEQLATAEIVQRNATALLAKLEAEAVKV